MDGKGRSGLVFNDLKFNALVGEFLYLGGTVVRLGFIIGEGVVWCHTFKNSNINDSVFVKSPTQPLRWEIRSTGGAGSFHHICGKVGTIRNLEVVGITRFHSMGATHVNAGTVGAKYALMGIRPNTRLRNINIIGIDGLALTTDRFLIELVLNPTIAGTFTYSTEPGHDHDIAFGATNGSNTISSGTVLGGMYVNTAGSGSINIDNLLRAGSTIDGIFDEMVLCVTPLGINLDIVGGMTVQIR